MKKWLNFTLAAAEKKRAAAWVKFMSEGYGKFFRISAAHSLKFQMVSSAILLRKENTRLFLQINLERNRL